MSAQRDRWLRPAFIFLLILNALLLLDRVAPRWTSVACAQVADTGAQLQQEIEQLKRVNESLTRIAKQLETGPVPVRVIKRDATATAKEGL